MSKFIMFGKYSAEGMKGISADRTKKAASIVKKFGGKVVSMYAILGKSDVLFVMDFPGVPEALKASVSLSKLTGITLQTSPVLEVAEFDKLMSEL